MDAVAFRCGYSCARSMAAFVRSLGRAFRSIDLSSDWWWLLLLALAAFLVCALLVAWYERRRQSRPQRRYRRGATHR